LIRIYTVLKLVSIYFLLEEKPEEFIAFPRCETQGVDLTEDDYMVSKQKCFHHRELGLNVFFFLNFMQLFSQDFMILN